VTKKVQRMLALMDRTTRLWHIPNVGRALPGQIVTAGPSTRKYPVPDTVAGRIPRAG